MEFLRFLVAHRLRGTVENYAEEPWAGTPKMRYVFGCTGDSMAISQVFTTIGEPQPHDDRMEGVPSGSGRLLIAPGELRAPLRINVRLPAVQQPRALC